MGLLRFFLFPLLRFHFFLPFLYFLLLRFFGSLFPSSLLSSFFLPFLCPLGLGLGLASAPSSSATSPAAPASATATSPAPAVVHRGFSKSVHIQGFFLGPSQALVVAARQRVEERRLLVRRAALLGAFPLKSSAGAGKVEVSVHLGAAGWLGRLRTRAGLRLRNFVCSSRRLRARRFGPRARNRRLGGSRWLRGCRSSGRSSWCWSSWSSSLDWRTANLARLWARSRRFRDLWRRWRYSCRGGSSGGGGGSCSHWPRSGFWWRRCRGCGRRRSGKIWLFWTNLVDGHIKHRQVLDIGPPEHNIFVNFRPGHDFLGRISSSSHASFGTERPYRL